MNLASAELIQVWPLILCRLKPSEILSWASTNRAFYYLSQEKDLWKMMIVIRWDKPQTDHYRLEYIQRYREDCENFLIACVNDVETARKIYAKGINLNSQTIDCSAELEMFELQLKAGIDPNYYSPLYSMIHDSDYAKSELLLRYGADPNARLKDRNYSCLAKAIESVEITELLLKYGADPHQQKLGYTPFTYAICEKKYDIVQIMLNYGADVNRKTEAGFAALHYCINFGDLKMLQILLSANNVDVNITTAEGDTPLMLMADKSDAEMAKLLLQRKDLRINQVNQEGQSALHIAIERDNYGLAWQFYLIGANPDLKDCNGNSARSLKPDLFDQVNKPRKIISIKRKIVSNQVTS